MAVPKKIKAAPILLTNPGLYAMITWPDYANDALDALCALELPLEVREYMLAHSSEFIHNYLPDQNSAEFLQDGATNLVNQFMEDLYHGEITSDQCLASGDKEFLQNPAMLSYWARSKGFSTISPNTPPSPDKMVLTYYPPLAKSYAHRRRGEVTDISNKHFYSHCKSSFYDNSNSAIVLNPELDVNSSISERDYTPEDAISYNINYEQLGLSSEAVQEGFRYMEADINIMDPQVQDRIFSLKDQGLSTDEIIEQCRGQYHYNLQEYNCAVKPVAPLIFANELKIHEHQKQDRNYDANACRQNLGLPNIYDPERYGQINQDFYAGYMEDARQNFSNTMGEGFCNGLQSSAQIAGAMTRVAREELRIGLRSSARTAGAMMRGASPALYIASTYIAEHAAEYLPEAREYVANATEALSAAYDRSKREAGRLADRGKELISNVCDWFTER